MTLLVGTLDPSQLGTHSPPSSAEFTALSSLPPDESLPTPIWPADDPLSCPTRTNSVKFEATPKPTSRHHHHERPREGSCDSQIIRRRSSFMDFGHRIGKSVRSVADKKKELTYEYSKFSKTTTAHGIPMVCLPSFLPRFTPFHCCNFMFPCKKQKSKRRKDSSFLHVFHFFRK